MRLHNNPFVWCFHSSEIDKALGHSCGVDVRDKRINRKPPVKCFVGAKNNIAMLCYKLSIDIRVTGRAPARRQRRFWRAKSLRHSPHIPRHR